MESLLGSRMARGLRSEGEPLAELDEEDVVGGDVEGLPQAAPEREAVSRPQRFVAARLRPDQVDEGAGAVFPARDEGRVELAHVEIGLRELVVGKAVPVLVEQVALADETGAAAKRREAVAEGGGARDRDALQVLVPSARREGRAVVLQGDVGRDREVETYGERAVVLAQPPEDVPRGPAEVEG